MILEYDPIKEADRNARLVNESNHFKKRAINNYGIDQSREEDNAIFDANLQIQFDIEDAKDIINGDYDAGICQDE